MCYNDLMRSDWSSLDQLDSNSSAQAGAVGSLARRSHRFSWPRIGLCEGRARVRSAILNYLLHAAAMQRVHGPVSSYPINPPVWNGVLLVESPTVFSCCSPPWTTHCQPMPATEWTMWLFNMTNYPLPYSRWFSVTNRFRDCQVWLLVSTSKYFRDRRFQGKRSRNDESAWTNYLHVICVLMLNIEPHILSISVCFSLESSVSYMNMDILQNRTGTVRILTLRLTITVIPNLLLAKHRFLLISLWQNLPVLKSVPNRWHFVQLRLELFTVESYKNRRFG